MQEAQGTADDGIAGGAVPVGGVGFGAREPGAQHGDEQQVEQAVQDGLLTGLVLDDLVGEQRDDGAVPLAVAQDEQPGQGAQQAPADLAVEVVGARQQDGPAVGGVAPRADAEAEALHELRAVRVEAAAGLVGIDRDLRGRGGIVGHGVVVGPADDRDIAGADRHRFRVVVQDPRVAADHRHDGERGLVLDPQRPRRVQARAQEERRPGSRAVEQACDGVHDGNPNPWTLADAVARLDYGPSRRTEFEYDPCTHTNTT